MTTWCSGREPKICFPLCPAYLLLDVVDLRPQPLDHAVDLSNLLLGVAQVVPVPASRDLQLLVLQSTERQGDVQASHVANAIRLFLN